MTTLLRVFGSSWPWPACRCERLWGSDNQANFFLLFSTRDREVKQLKGKRVAVSNFGSANRKSARTALEHAGLDAQP